MGELSRIFLASIVTTIFQAVGITLLFMRMPVAYYIVGAGTQFVLITAVRFAYRYITLLRAKQVTNQVAVHNAMVIGAGASGQMILKELMMSERANARPLCIIDDNPNKWEEISEEFLSSVAVIALWKASKSIILIRSFLQFQLHHLRTKGYT